MNTILNIYQTILSSEPEYFPLLLNTFAEHQVFQNKSGSLVDPLYSQITSFLNIVESKHKGLLLLNTVLPQCDSSVLEERGIVWINLIIKVCLQKNQQSSIPIAYNVLEKLLNKSVDISELSKAIKNNALSKIIESIVNIPCEYHLNALGCLEICLQTYPSSSGPFKNMVEKFLLSFADYTDNDIVYSAAKCLHLLQQIKSGHQNVSVQNLWTHYHLQLIESIHNCLNGLYCNVIETIGSDSNNTPLNIPDINGNISPVTKTTKLVTRLMNLTTFLEVALIEPFPTPKGIRPMEILKLILRGTAINCETLSKNLIFDNIILGSLIPEIHIHLLNILNSLILLIKDNMSLYCKSICEIFKQLISWTSTGMSKGTKKPFTNLKIATYSTISLWCQTMNYGSRIEIIVDKIVEEILNDVTPYESKVVLKVLSGSRKYLSKRARKKLQTAENELSNIVQTHAAQSSKIIISDIDNAELCSAALICLKNVLQAAGCFMKPVLHKIIQEKIIEIALNALSSVENNSTIYDSAECRENLYAVLNNIITSCHYLCPSPIQYVIEILSLAQMKDNHCKNREMCKDLVLSLDGIIHPHKGELFLYPDKSEIKEALHMTKQMSEFITPHSFYEMSPLVESSEGNVDLGADKQLTEPITEIVETNINNEVIKDNTLGINTLKETIEIDKAEPSKDSNIVQKANSPPPPPINNLVDTGADVLNDVINTNVLEDNNKVNGSEVEDKVQLIENDTMLDTVTAKEDTNLIEPETKKRKVDYDIDADDVNSTDIISKLASYFVDELNDYDL